MYVFLPQLSSFLLVINQSFKWLFTTNSINPDIWHEDEDYQSQSSYQSIWTKSDAKLTQSMTPLLPKKVSYGHFLDPNRTVFLWK